MSRMPDEGGFEIARAYMTVDADTGEATSEVDELEERAAELHGTLTIDADISPAEAKLEELDASLEGRGATLTVDADTAPAEASAAGLEAQLDDLDGTATVTADTAPAEAGLELVDEKLHEIDAAAGAVTVGANIAPAETALEGLHGQIDATTGSVKVGADIAPAQAELAVLEAEIEGVKGSADDLNFSGAAGSAGEMAERLEAGAGAASQIAGDLGPLAGGAGDVDSALTGAADAAGSFGQQAMATSEDIDDLIGRFQAAATEFHELNQIANLPGMSSIGGQIESLAQDLDALNARGGATASDLEGLELRLDEIGDALDNAHAHALQFGNGIESMSADLQNSRGMYDGAAAEIDRMAEGADDAGESFMRLRTGASLLDDAMADVHNDMQAAWDAATALNLSLSETENIGEVARAVLEELGASELQAAAGAEALVKAQQEFDNLMAGGPGGGGGIAGWISSLFNVGGEGGGLASTVASLSAGVAAAVAFVAAMAEVGGVVTGVSAALLGIAPAVALALPSLDSLKNSYEGISTARKNWTQAEQVAKRDPTAENLAAAATDAAKLKVAYADVPSYIRPVMKDISGLSGEYTQMAKAFEPDVFGVFNRGLKIAEELLPTFKPLADQAVSGIDSVLDRVEKFFKEPQDTKHGATGVLAEHNPLQQALAPPTGWEKWLKEITPDISASIKAIGTTIGTIATSWGKFMKTFSPKDIQTAFHILDDLITAWGDYWTNAIQHVMTGWDELTTGIRNVGHWSQEFNTAVSRAGDVVRHDIASAFDDVRHTIASFFSWTQSAQRQWDSDFIKGIEDGFRDLVSETKADFDQIVSQTKQYWDELVSETEADWDDAGHAVSDALDTIREGVITAGHDIESAWDETMSTIENSARQDWDDIEHDVSDALDTVRESVISAGHDIEAAWDAGVSDVEHITSELVHDIESAFTALPGELEHLGEEAIEGLAHGIEDAAGDVLSAIGHIASSIPSSLGKLLDMGSPSRVLRALGHDTMEGYRLGVLDYEGPITSAIKQVGGATVGAAATAFTSHGAPVPVRGSIAPAAERAGGTTVTVNLNGITSFPNPEQLAALEARLATAVGISG
jgi:hypothetical protein